MINKSNPNPVYSHTSTSDNNIILHSASCRTGQRFSLQGQYWRCNLLNEYIDRLCVTLSRLSEMLVLRYVHHHLHILCSYCTVLNFLIYCFNIWWKLVPAWKLPGTEHWFLDDPACSPPPCRLNYQLLSWSPVWRRGRIPPPWTCES
jgi:hypothetical protein